MDIIEIFAHNTLFYRKNKNLSQEQLALKSELHRTYISSVERGKRNVSLKNIKKIAYALDIEPYQLLIDRSKGKGWEQ